MSIISSYEVDNSAALARRFASLAREYFENPAAAKNTSAQVPLENIFRLLEMFRYGSFEDETRSGVLALQSLEPERASPLNDTSWHTTIEVALKRAVSEAYGNVDKTEAIDQLEDSLRWLATGKKVPEDTLERAREFFEKFEALV